MQSLKYKRKSHTSSKFVENLVVTSTKSKLLVIIWRPLSIYPEVRQVYINESRVFGKVIK